MFSALPPLSAPSPSGFSQVVRRPKRRRTVNDSASLSDCGRRLSSSSQTASIVSLRKQPDRLGTTDEPNRRVRSPRTKRGTPGQETRPTWGTAGWSERCRLGTLTGRPTGKLGPLVAAPTGGFLDFNRPSRRVHEEGFDGIPSQSIKPRIGPQYAQDLGQCVRGHGL